MKYIQHTVSFVDKYSNIIDERMEYLITRNIIKSNLKDKKIKNINNCELRTYVRVSFLLGEPI